MITFSSIDRLESAALVTLREAEGAFEEARVQNDAAILVLRTQQLDHARAAVAAMRALLSARS